MVLYMRSSAVRSAQTLHKHRRAAHQVKIQQSILKMIMYTFWTKNLTCYKEGGLRFCHGHYKAALNLPHKSSAPWFGWPKPGERLTVDKRLSWPTRVMGGSLIWHHSFVSWNWQSLLDGRWKVLKNKEKEVKLPWFRERINTIWLPGSQTSRSYHVLDVWEPIPASIKVHCISMFIDLVYRLMIAKIHFD